MTTIPRAPLLARIPMIVIACIPLLAREVAAAPRKVNVESTLARGNDFLARHESAAALDLARTTLAAVADDPRLLDLASRAADASGDRDLALWYARHALDVATSFPRYDSIAWTIRNRIERLDPLDGRPTQSIAAHFDRIYALAEYARRSRLPANAVDLFSRLDETPLAAKADRQIRKILDDPASVRSIVTADLDLRGRDALFGIDTLDLEQRDGTHRAWPDAEKIASPRYTVVTNAGYEKGLTVSRAMEHMNRFYRDFFAPFELGGIPSPCEIRLYRTRDEFIEREKIADRSIEALFDPRANRVATFDPTSVGLPFSDLWTTLFHEASHQFTDRFSYADVPGWIHEGTSTYFEGSSLRGAGIVQTNRIPERRLHALLDVLDRGRPAIRDVIAAPSVRAYPREYYSVGWGLVYFLLNYTDESSRPLYREAYINLVRSYRTPSRLPPELRFERAFVEDIDDASVRSFADFEQRFVAWIRDLADLHEGPVERAERLIERAERAGRDGELDIARDRYQWALRKKPDDAPTHAALGRILEAQGSIDAAILAYRRAVRILRRDPVRTRAALEKDCTQRIRKLSRAFALRLDTDDSALAREVAGAVTELREAGFPRHATFLLRDAAAVLGPHPRLVAARRALTASHSVDARRWRRLPTANRLTSWIGAEGFRGQAPGQIAGFAQSMRSPTHRTTPRLPYRYEITIEIDPDRRPAKAGLSFGASIETGQREFYVDRAGTLFSTSPQRGPHSLERLAALSEAKPERVTLAVEVDESGRTRFLANEVPLAERRYDPRTLRGRLGILLEGGTATYRDLRVRY